ncbi:MAG: oligoendopeptidase F [Clostridiales bacterium]|jgi:oligoendopeptidase F|nr:oligoendopeptidase F [Clostridiales bacterium]
MKAVKTREDLSPADKWRPEDLFASDGAWEAEYKEVLSEIPRLAAYKGILKNAKAVKGCMTLVTVLGSRAEMLHLYSHIRRDENTVADAYVRMSAKTGMLFKELFAASAFIDPELTALPAQKLQAIADNKMLREHDYELKRLIAAKPHVLSESEESILAQMSEFTGKFGEIFSVIDNAELGLPVIEVDGEKVQLTHGVYAKLLQHKDKAVRKLAFDGLYETFKKRNNTLATTYSADVIKDIFYSRVRKYDNYLEKVLSAEDVPAEVYFKLISAVNGGLPAMHDYVALRKKLMGLDTLNMYDMYVPIVEGAELSLKYKDAYKLVLEGLAPLGAEYNKLLKKAYKDGWIDVYETENKRSGAYSTFAYNAPHPYVLLNYSATTHDVFTIAHELGHSMHSYYSAKFQPEPKASYKIFVAEVASTVNEMLLLEHLLRTTEDAGLKKFLLSYKLDSIRTTIFRQTMFSEFELKVHYMAETDEPLSASVLNELYYELNKKYYGPSVEHDDYIKYEWSRIPHFYYSFYVYKYATGLTAAINIAESILSGGDAELKRYYDFLKAGGSKSPYEILRDAGVDLAADAPYIKLMDVFDKTLKELS